MATLNADAVALLFQIGSQYLEYRTQKTMAQMGDAELMDELVKATESFRPRATDAVIAEAKARLPAPGDEDGA
jgi:hypothetical protein